MTGILDKLFLLLATGFGVGFSKKAPGTLGSLVGIPLGVMIGASGLDLKQRIFLFLVLMCVGLFITYKAESVFKIHDDQRIVIDEVIGQALTIGFFEPSVLVVGLGFALFRLFDIWKPGPIGYIDEHLPGAWGTFFDDIVAALFGVVVLHLILRMGLHL